jgi:2-succinyl-5-enolpyruvyl-6-hydroxy-3-cyclohexene-1-carboxylate synthase
MTKTNLMPLAADEIFDALTRSNVNSTWGGLCMEVLARLGVETVVTSPGSRSTPLTIAAARNPRIEALSILDERSAAFYALGLAKRTRRPVALVCTSGSAVVNYWPAVVEASMGGTPLLLLTGDRPPEMRACSSGQTIDQLKVFGDYVRAFVEFALPSVEAGMLAYLRQSLVHAVQLSLGPNAGPVHLNFPFRDPLAPDLAPEAQPVVEASVLEATATVITRPCEAVPVGGPIDLVAIERLCSHTQGIIVVGTEHPRGGEGDFAAAVTMLSAKLGWPVLADVLNPMRNHASQAGAVITHYDAFLREGAPVDSLAPTAVLQIGSLPTSKVLRAWLASVDAVSFLLSTRPLNTDPLHRIATPIYAEAHELAVHLEHQRVDLDWSARWAAVEAKTAEVLDQAMAGLETMFEGKVAWLLARHLPVGTPVYLANSMSVRYAEYFWPATCRGHAIYCNRGANGIDGTLSTALGVAHRAKQAAVLLTGDLAFLHDSNGLLAVNQLKGSLTVVLINNQGGGIFEHLPVSQMESDFETYFATPQNVDIAQLCVAHGMQHQGIADWAQFVAALSEPASPGLRVLELKTDRKMDKAQLVQLLQQVAQSF